MFAHYLTAWHLTPIGDPITTPTSDLLPVIHNGQPAMLKIARVDEERVGNSLLAWWEGDGAARVLAHDGDAILMERATGAASLVAMVAHGQADAATRVICEVAARLHAPRDRPTPDLVPLTQWFRQLWPVAEREGGVIGHAAVTARELLATPREIVTLHGDLHHGNILDFGEHGWLAIDPKGLIGDRGFDFANILRNPDNTTATTPGYLARQSTVIAETANLDRATILKWTLALCGLSAAWYLDDGEDPTADLAIATIAGEALSW